MSFSGIGLAACILWNVICDNEVVSAKLAHTAYDKGRELGSTIVLEGMALGADNDQFVEQAW